MKNSGFPNHSYADDQTINSLLQLMP